MKRLENNDKEVGNIEEKAQKAGKEKKRKHLKKERKEEKRLAKRAKPGDLTAEVSLSFTDWLAHWGRLDGEAVAPASALPSGMEAGMAAWRKMAVEAGWPDAMAAVHGVLWWNGSDYTQDDLMEWTGVSRGSVHGALQALMDRGLAEVVDPAVKGKKRYRAIHDPGRLVEALWLDPWKRSLHRWSEVVSLWAQRATSQGVTEGDANAERWKDWANRAERLSRSLLAFERGQETDSREEGNA
jgi:DNA-binding transcriptional regulator GbsR (MarR family)